MSRSFGRAAVAALLCALILVGGAPSSVAAQAAPPAMADPDVAATVELVLTTAQHPRLRWPDIPEMAPVLKTAYETEADRLLWFDGTTPLPVVTRALGALGNAGEHGLDSADYDAGWLTEEWALLSSGAEVSGPDRALFDVGLSVAVVRLLSAVHLGRVDPATLHWGYDVSPKVLDLRERLGEVRDGKPVDLALAELEPPFAHSARARGALAVYKELAENEPTADQAHPE